MDAFSFVQVVWRFAEVCSIVSIGICAIIYTVRNRK